MLQVENNPASMEMSGKPTGSCSSGLWKRNPSFRNEQSTVIRVLPEGRKDFFTARICWQISVKQAGKFPFLVIFWMSVGRGSEQEKIVSHLLTLGILSGVTA